MGARGGRRSFGAGSYARRHQQGYQALTGALVMGTAIAALTLHHFGFWFALLLAIGAAAVCAVARVRPAASIYLTGAALLAGIVLAPPYVESARTLPSPAPVAHPIEVDGSYQFYVQENSPLSDALEAQPRLDLEEWAPPSQDDTTPRIFEL